MSCAIEIDVHAAVFQFLLHTVIAITLYMEVQTYRSLILCNVGDHLMLVIFLATLTDTIFKAFQTGWLFTV